MVVVVVVVLWLFVEVGLCMYVVHFFSVVAPGCLDVQFKNTYTCVLSKLCAYIEHVLYSTVSTYMHYILYHVILYLRRYLYTYKLCSTVYFDR